MYTTQASHDFKPIVRTQEDMSKLEENICPSCYSGDLSVFYEVERVPVNSCLLFSSREEAASIPRGDVKLGFCRSCGFIFNIAFDSSKLDYSTLAPEEQRFSGTFKTFAERLASRLVQTYDLRNKHVSEIGCGRGDFLALICDLGNNHGVGIDPSTVTGCLVDGSLDNMEFIRDYYSKRYAKYLGDFVSCRHTLEHIPNTAEFLNSVRSAIADNSCVFFEVPDVSRILGEVAFWDIFYDHCSYFNTGSLARLFRFCNFEIVYLAKDYFDQYLLIDAKPVNCASNKMNENEESIESTANRVELFSKSFGKKLNYWRKLLKQLKSEGKKAIVWGSGSKCVAFMSTLGVEDEIEYIVDINPNRHGKFIPGVGKQIMPPEFLIRFRPDSVIVMNPVYCEEIRKKLATLGLCPELVPCL